MIAAGHLGPGHRQDVHRPPLIQTDVELVVGPEISQASGDRMVRIDDADVERPVRVMRVLGIPDHAGQLAKSRPVTKCPAGEVNQHQAAALLTSRWRLARACASCGSGCSLRKWSRISVMVEHGVRRQDVRILDDPHDTAAVLFEQALERRRGFLPVVGRMVHPGDEENAHRAGAGG